MGNTRTYGDACAAAHALDLVGERWALLVIRELLFGPKRFSDLRAGLANVGPNRLAQRLRELERTGIIRRRKLGPPAGSWVYELTDWGAELEPVLIYLGRWGRRSPFRDLEADISPDALMLALRSDFAPEPSQGVTTTVALHFGEDHFALRIADGQIQIARGDPVAPDATLVTDTRSFAAVLTRRRSLQDALIAKDVRLAGEIDAARRLLACYQRPRSADILYPGHTEAVRPTDLWPDTPVR